MNLIARYRERLADYAYPELWMVKWYAVVRAVRQMCGLPHDQLNPFRKPAPPLPKEKE